jgi:hypothetical protein
LSKTNIRLQRGNLAFNCALASSTVVEYKTYIPKV